MFAKDSCHSQIEYLSNFIDFIIMAERSDTTNRQSSIVNLIPALPGWVFFFVLREEDRGFAVIFLAAVFPGVAFFLRGFLLTVSLFLSHLEIRGANSFWHFELT